MEQASTAYYQALRESPAVEYLESRGLNGASAQHFRLGYVAEPLTGHDYLKGRLCIPYLTRAGVTELKFRRLGDGNGPKYLYQTGATSERIYNPEALFRPLRYICVTEGELDCVTAEQCGISAVGIPGVDNWQPFFARVFAGYDKVLILGDADDGAGQGEGFANELAALVPNARVIMMPRGYDVNSFYIAEGAQALREKVGLD